MKLLAISNLVPRPDQPTRGMYNAQTFSQLAGMANLDVLALVPEWRPWQQGAIRRWECPHATLREAVRYAPVSYVPLIGRSLGGALYTRSLARESEAFSACDAVFSSWLYPDGVAATRLATRAGKPSWMMALGSDTFHLQSSHRRSQIVEASQACAGIICVCELLADRLADAGVDRGKLHVVPNGVDTDRFQYRNRDDAVAALRENGCGSLLARCMDGTPLILFVGNLVPVKGPDRLLSAFEQFTTVSDARLLFVGDGPMRAQLEARVRQTGLGERALFVGARPHDEIPLWMSLADVLCLPSRSEGMPNVVLESLACGLPVLAADVGACREMLRDDAAGNIVDWRDPLVPAAALERALAAPPDRPALARLHGARTWEQQAADIMGHLTAGRAIR